MGQRLVVTVLTYAVEREQGETTHHLMAQDLDISSAALCELLPQVRDSGELIDSSGRRMPLTNWSG